MNYRFTHDHLKVILTLAISLALFNNSFSQYCTTGLYDFGCTDGDDIGIFQFNTINNNTTFCPGASGYSDYTNISTVVSKNQTYNLTVGTGSPVYSQGFGIWIDFNHNTSFNDPGEFVYASPSSSTSTFSGTISIPPTALSGPTRMRVRGRFANTLSASESCSLFSYGETEDYTVIILGSASNDAGVASIDSPTVFCPGVKNVKASIQNFGINVINTVSIGWSVNGVVQSPSTYPSPLDTIGGSGINKVQVNLGTYSFVQGQYYTIKVWTSNPNGMTDTVTINDTATIVVTPAISGTFTIGGTSPDFSTVTDAVNALNVGGVCGPVIFSMAPGIYKEQITIKKFNGSSAINTVTFKASNNDSTSVILEYESTGSAQNYTLNLQGSEFVIFQNLTIRALGKTYGRVIQLEGSAHHNTIQNAILETDSTIQTTSTNFAIVYDVSNSNNEYNTYKNNHLKGGSYGFYLWGLGTTNPTRGTVIENNKMSPYYMGVYLYYNMAPKITSNIIHTQHYTSSYGIYAWYADSGLVISKNKINIELGAYGIYLGSPSAKATNPGMVINNFVTMGGAGTAYGIYVTNTANFLNIFNNSINIVGINQSGGVGLYYTASGGNNKVVNNIIANTGGGYAAYYSNTFSLDTVNNNDYYAPAGGNFVYWGSDVADLAALKALSGKDQNSISINPFYESNTNLHANLPVNDKGKPLPGLTEDIDGEARSSTNPDIGADEFTPAAMDLASVQVSNPTESCGLTSAESIIIQMMNFGLNTLSVGQSIQMYYSINGGAPISETLILLSAANSLDTITFTFTAKANLSDSGVYNIKVWQAMSGDNIHKNDTINLVINNNVVKNFPYIEDFEKFLPGATTAFPNGWKRTFGSDQPWRPISGITPTNSGPFYDFNPKSLSGIYMYTNTANGNIGDEFIITSPCLNISTLTNPGFDLAYHMSSSSVGDLSIDIIGNGTTYSNFRVIEGSQGPNWNQMAVALDSFKTLGANIIQVQIRAAKGAYGADIAFDDFRIGELPQISLPDTIMACGFVKLDAGNPGAKYSWSTGDTSRILVVKAAAFTTTQSISLTVTNAQGIRNFKTITVTLTPGPYIELGNDTVVCDQTSTILDAGNTGTVMWSTGATTQTITVSTPGTYSASVTSQGCTKSDTIQVSFDKSPVAMFTFTDDPNSSFTTFNSTGSIGSTFQWEFGDKAGSTEPNPSHYYGSPGGTYTVMLIVTNACGSDTMIQTVNDINIGIPQIDGLSEVKIYPNPSEGLFQLEIETGRVGDIQWSIYNLQGQLIITHKEEQIKEMKTSLDLNNLAKGIYYLRINAGGEMVVRKIVIQ